MPLFLFRTLRRQNRFSVPSSLFGPPRVEMSDERDSIEAGAEGKGLFGTSDRFADLKEGDGTTEDSGVDLSGTGVNSLPGVSSAAVGSSHDPHGDDDHEDEHHRSRLMEEMVGIRRYLFEKLHLTNFGRDQTDSRPLPKVLDTVDFAGVLKHWNEGKFKKIITMVGAGISTSAGIPDFRSPKTGLYHNLQKYDLPHPSAIFELDYFMQNPKPFFTLARELYPGAFKPTPCHYFIKLLESRGMLHRHYTQNIDTLEHIARISPEKIVEAHGSFYTNHCLTCRQSYTKEWMKTEIFADRIPTCTVPECGGIVKPDIVFFGESLPAKFHDSIDDDFDDCDLLIIMGTSLEVQPFASLPDRVNDSCVRLLVNREIVGNKQGSIWSLLSGLGIGGSLEFGQPNSRRDVAWLGDCDDGAFALARGLGMEDELRRLIAEGHAEIDAETAAAAAAANVSLPVDSSTVAVAAAVVVATTPPHPPPEGSPGPSGHL